MTYPDITSECLLCRGVPIGLRPLLHDRNSEHFHHDPVIYPKENATMAFNTWELLDAVLGTTRRTLLHGLPGTGKTYAASKRGLADSQKVYEITLTEETPAAEIRGHFVPKDNNFIWMDGPGLRAWREGARLVINEIDRASADCMSLLNALLDDPEFAELTLPTGEIVRPAEGFQVVATMNGVPDDLEPSLQDRFPVTIHIAEVNPEAIASLDPDLRDAALNTSVLEGDRRVSIRAWMEYGNLRTKLAKRDGITAKQATEIAAQAVFGNRAKQAMQALRIDASKK